MNKRKFLKNVITAGIGMVLVPKVLRALPVPAEARLPFVGTVFPDIPDVPGIGSRSFVVTLNMPWAKRRDVLQTRSGEHFILLRDQPDGSIIGVNPVNPKQEILVTRIESEVIADVPSSARIISNGYELANINTQYGSESE